MTSKITRDAVLEALGKVQDPELGKDLVSLNMIQDIVIEGDRVTFKLVLTTPSCPLRTTLENDARNAVTNIAGVKEVDIHVSANVPRDQKIQKKLEIKVKNAIAVGSGKGGVGKTTLAVNLAVALAKKGSKVGLLDADIYGPNVPTMMGIYSTPHWDEKKIIPPVNYDVKVMSIGFMVPADQPLIWRGPMLHSAIQQFIGDVDWGELDYLVIDLPPGTGDAPLSLAQSLPLSGGIIVTLPQQVSLEDARRGIEMFRKLDIPVFGVVENMSYLELPDGTHMDVFGNGGGQRLAELAGVPFLGGIPMDPAVRVGGDSGLPIIITQPESKVAKALLSVSETVAGCISVSALKA